MPFYCLRSSIVVIGIIFRRFVVVVAHSYISAINESQWELPIIIIRAFQEKNSTDWLLVICPLAHLLFVAQHIGDSFGTHRQLIESASIRMIDYELCLITFIFSPHVFKTSNLGKITRKPKNYMTRFINIIITYFWSSFGLCWIDIYSFSFFN